MKTNTRKPFEPRVEIKIEDSDEIVSIRESVHLEGIEGERVGIDEKVRIEEVTAVEGVEKQEDGVIIEEIVVNSAAVINTALETKVAGKIE